MHHGIAESSPSTGTHVTPRSWTAADRPPTHPSTNVRVVWYEPYTAGNATEDAEAPAHIHQLSRKIKLRAAALASSIPRNLQLAGGFGGSTIRPVATLAEKSPRRFGGMTRPEGERETGDWKLTQRGDHYLIWLPLTYPYRTCVRCCCRYVGDQWLSRAKSIMSQARAADPDAIATCGKHTRARVCVGSTLKGARPPATAV